MQKSDSYRNTTSPHILNTATNMLGLCFFIVAYLRTAQFAEKTYFDEITGLAAIIFAFSCFFSFFSLKKQKIKEGVRSELIADILFFIGISIIVFVVLLSFKWFF
ncbi:MAG: hypothetical protein WC819_05465 [Parcubacteria group bacterium]|jgi:hypothetical protein